MDSTLGHRIRARRQRQGWTLKSLADATGLSVPYLSDLERDTGANPTLETLRLVARALDTSLHDLVGDDQMERGEDVPLSISLQRFVNSPEFEAHVQRLAGRLDRPADEQLRREAMNFLANAPRRSKGELTKTDWKQLLDFYMVIAEK